VRVFEGLRNIDAQCARILGYDECGCGHDECDLWGPPAHLNDGGSYKPFPAFSSDARLVKVLLKYVSNHGLRCKYIENLVPEYHALDALFEEDLFEILCATPEQHARAFVVTMGVVESALA
jgi:hypothetical protein